jgi:hypothetical protein
MRKVIKDGKVAVLVSPGFGGGWYTWNDDLGLQILFDPDIVNAVLNGDFVVDVVEKLYPEAFTGGVKDLEVVWVPQGSRFEVREYDGSESLKIFEPEDGIIA